jgi:MFS family permease
MVMGSLLFTVMPLLYPLVIDIPLLWLVRILHGAGLALFFTASNAFLSHEIPTERRAEGMSHYGNAVKLAMAFGPPLGLFFAIHGYFRFHPFLRL